MYFALGTVILYDLEQNLKFPPLDHKIHKRDMRYIFVVHRLYSIFTDAGNFALGTVMFLCDSEQNLRFHPK